MAISKEKIFEFVRRNPVGVISGVISLALIVTYSLRSSQGAEAEAVLGTKRAESDRYQANITNAGGVGAQELKDNYDTLVALNKQIATRLIRTQMGVNYTNFEKILAETGAKRISLNQIPPSGSAKAVPKGGFVPVGFSFVVQGTYGQLLDVLYRLENGQPFCRVLTASVNKGGGSGPGSDLLTLNLNLELLGLQQ